MEASDFAVVLATRLEMVTDERTVAAKVIVSIYILVKMIEVL